MAPLGIQVSKEEAGALFDAFDPDGSGAIEYRELDQLLRRRVDIGAEKRAALARDALPPSMHVLTTTLSLPTGAEKRAALARDAHEREQRNEESRRQLAAHTDATKRRFGRVPALSHLPPPSMHVLTTTLSLPHRCVHWPRQSTPSTAPSTPKTARAPLTMRAVNGLGSRL